MCRMCNHFLLGGAVPSGFGPGFIYQASSLFVVTFNLAILGTEKYSGVTLGPSKGEEEDSLQHTPPWQCILRYHWFLGLNLGWSLEDGVPETGPHMGSPCSGCFGCGRVADDR